MADHLSKPLIVPVHLDGICLANETIENPLAAPTASFVPLNDIQPNVSSTDAHKQAPYLSGDQLVEIFGSSSNAQKGVYLHWAFPAALTHGQTHYEVTDQAIQKLQHQGIPLDILTALDKLKGQTFSDADSFQEATSKLITGKADQSAWFQFWIDRAATQVSFPHLPNRWLVVRISQTDATPKAWLIESDYLSTQNIYGEARTKPDSKCYYLDSAQVLSPNSPQEDQTNHKPFMRFMGRVRGIDEKWILDDPNPEYHPNLNAMGYGAMSFSGYLPDCPHVFAFMDPAEDLPASGEMNYMVVGWYNDDAKDPLGGSLNADQIKTLLANYDWTAPEYDKNPAVLNGVSGSLYCGMLKAVHWDSGKAYFPDPNISGDSVKAMLGHSTTEALAAFVAENKTSASNILPEDAINALQMGILPKVQQSLEKDAVLQEANHTAGFRSEEGGYLWQITPKQKQPNPDMDSGQQFDQYMSSGKTNLPPLPEEVSTALNQLNIIQQAYDKAFAELNTQRQELYAHWYWYNRWNYQPNASNPQTINEGVTNANTMKEEYIKPIRLHVNDRSFWNKYYNKQLPAPIINITKKQIPDFSVNLSHQEYQLEQLILQISTTLNDLQTSLSKVKLTDAYQLTLVPAPRYWHPNDPVLMLADLKNLPSSRIANQEGRGFLNPIDSNDEGTSSNPLFCRIPSQLLKPTTGSSPSITTTDPALEPYLPLVNSLLAEVNFLNQQDLAQIQPGKAVSGANGYAPGRMAMTEWGIVNGEEILKTNPWHPVILQYEVNYYYLDKSGDYTKESLTDYQALDLNHIDLRYKSETKSLPTKWTPYMGSVVMSHKAVSTLHNQLSRMTTLSQNSIDPLIKELQTWVNDLGDTPIMSQALNGFYDNLLARLRTLKLDIYDPYADDWDAPDSTAAEIAQGVGQFQQSIPQSLDIYNPLQNGFVEISKIRIVDAFGQYREIEQPEIVSPLELNPKNRTLNGEFPPVTLNNNNQGNFFSLAPRLAQPTRLNFRWISANDDQVEMNSHPASSPICGWVISNHLDNSLMIFDQAGTHLGALQTFADDQTQKVQWVPAPHQTGQPLPPAPDQIKNPHLKAFINGFQNKETSQNFNAFRSAIERVLLTIEPSTYRQHSPLTVLMGRPLALTQASVQLQYKGKLAIDLTENSFLQYIQGKGFISQDFDQIQVPVRLGDLSLVNDGLVGYFKASDAINASTFQAEDETDSLLLSTADPQSTRLLMLVDPRAKIHATSGVLPIKSIEIPPDQYADALKKMEFTFLASPVLSPQADMKMPLPAETNSQWSFISRSSLTRSVVLFPAALGVISAFPSDADLIRNYQKQVPNAPKPDFDKDLVSWALAIYLYYQNDPLGNGSKYWAFPTWQRGGQAGAYARGAIFFPQDNMQAQQATVSDADLSEVWRTYNGISVNESINLDQIDVWAGSVFTYYQQYPHTDGKMYWAFPTWEKETSPQAGRKVFLFPRTLGIEVQDVSEAKLLASVKRAYNFPQNWRWNHTIEGWAAALGVWGQQRVPGFTAGVPTWQQNNHVIPQKPDNQANLAFPSLAIYEGWLKMQPYEPNSKNY
jgi:hypothetical protein